MNNQTQKSVDSFSWQWTRQSVIDSPKTFYRRLFKECGIFHDYLDGKVVADVCSGNGRHVWAINNLSKNVKIISIELSEDATDHQKEAFDDMENIIIIQGDAENVKFQADFIYMIGAIQHVARPEMTLENIMGNLNWGGGSWLLVFI
ncbi:MAG TPA: class I SAM-dependent methyltransferase [Gammaproteobacteria bacterium]|nr:class I SAM-dependent methyltransferase [Gammaproteobacteria bacterium]